MSKIVLIGYNAHENCSEGVARITYNTFRGLRSIGEEAYLVSIIDTSFEDTFKGRSDSPSEIYVMHSNGKTTYVRLLQILEAIMSSSTSERVTLVFNALGLLRRAILREILRLLSFRICVLYSLFSRPFKLFERLTYVNSHGVLVYSPSEYKYLTRTMPIVADKVFLALTPIDTEKFSPRNKVLARDILCRSTDICLDKNEIVVGYMGNPFPDRLPPSFYKVFKKITEKFDLKLLIISPPYSGRSYKAYFERLLDKLKIRENVVYAEKFINYDLRPYVYSSLDIYLHLYLWKEAPYPFLTALEAMSSGVLTVLTDSVEWIWVSENGKVAPIVKIDNLEISLYGTFLNILNNEEFRNSDMTRAIRERIVSLFSLKTSSLHFVKGVEKLCMKQ